MKKLFEKAVSKIGHNVKKPVRKRKLKKLLSDGLPPSILPAIHFLVQGKIDSDAAQVANKMEKIRSNIAAGGQSLVEILYSPKPGESIDENNITPDLRPEHGERMMFTMEQVAQTGKSRSWGIVLYLLSRECKAEVILELGSCAGISGGYLAASDHCKILHTIEGSAPLASLASETISQISPKYKVHNLLFDEALDDLLPKLDHVDLAFIDGHHEKIATIHYWQRIAPKMRDGGIVIFDDVSWSQDMRDCWNYLSVQPEFSHAFDFGSIGICICDKSPSTHTHKNRPCYWDLQPVVGRKGIGTPHGWKD